MAEPVPGLSHARNRAVAECETELIAFLDDDEVACRYWASELVRSFIEEPAVDCVAGLIAPVSCEHRPSSSTSGSGGTARGVVSGR